MHLPPPSPACRYPQACHLLSPARVEPSPLGGPERVLSPELRLCKKCMPVVNPPMGFLARLMSVCCRLLKICLSCLPSLDVWASCISDQVEVFYESHRSLDKKTGR